MNTTEPRDIVLAPNRDDSPTFGKVFEKFMSHQGENRLSSWTCKKSARPGDLYLFYFGSPHSKISGLAVCSTSPDPEGQKERGWNNRQKMFYCEFERLRHFKKPITVAELREIGSIDNWWESRPYRGRPKTIPPAAAGSLLKLVARREPQISKLLTEYISACAQADSPTMNLKGYDAWEGTAQERLSSQPVRSKALRDAKIREELAAHGRLICEVSSCGFDFYDVYGELGRGFAHVHHRYALAGNRRRRTKTSDLAIVCANCHAMIHRWGQCRNLADLVTVNAKR